MVVLFHRNDPWDVVECHCPQSEIRVVLNLVDFSQESVQIIRFDSVDMRDEVRRG